MMLFLVLCGFVLAVLAPVLYQYSKKIAPYLFAAYPLLFFIYTISELSAVQSGPVLEIFPWIPLLGINLSFYLDGISLLFTLLISGIGFLVLIYAAEYMKTDAKANRFYLYILLFMASMLGLVLSGNLISMFIFWELTSISSFFLIGHKHKDEKARKSALQALIVTAGGGLLMLAGMVFIGSIYGTFEFSEMLSDPDMVIRHPAYIVIVLLIAAGAFTKSAQFPFHFWLPNAMSAPTPVSAYLHSATMVKAGVFLLMRLSPILGGTLVWENLLMFFGAATMLAGAVLSIFESDLKKILAYSTVSSLGTLVMLTGIGEEYAIKAAIVFLVVHSLYKGAFFLVAGSVDLLTHSRDINKLGGLYKHMPLIALAGIAAALSNSGIPSLFGFVGKELIYEAAITAGEAGYLFIGLAVFSNILLVVAAINAGIKPFSGRNTKAPVIPSSTPFSLWFGPVVLGITSLTAGLFPGLMTGLFTPAVSGILNKPVIVELALWHGFNLVLLLSALTVAAGAGIYFLRLYRAENNSRLRILQGIGPEKWYNLGFSAVLGFAGLQTRLIQNSYLRYYLLTIIVTLIFLISLTIYNYLGLPEDYFYKDLMMYEAFLVLSVNIAIILVMVTKSRLTAVAGLGLIGYGLAIVFVLFGAPDIAMTQFTIDTLTVILFVLILWKLPPFLSMSPSFTRIRDLLISLFTGALITYILLVIVAKPSDPDLRMFFAENSYLLAHGRNVVNVILVDFRGLDTMVEITVLAVAAIGVYALLKLKKTD